MLDQNKSERHIRGGLATKEKYLHQHAKTALSGVKILLKMSDLCIQRDFES